MWSQGSEVSTVFIPISSGYWSSISSTALSRSQKGGVLYEICITENCSAKRIRESIVINDGYLSRILDSFVRRGLIEKTPSPTDRRLRIILPTEKRKEEFSQLNGNSDTLISQMIEELSEDKRKELVEKMEGIRALLEKSDEQNNLSG